MQKDAPILLVDSSPTLLLLERTLLARRGWRIESVGSVGEAKAVLARETPLIVISSDRLPDGSGQELCLSVREDERTRDVPFVFVVGRQDADLVEGCRRAGGTTILFKPLRGSDVDGAVNQILGLQIRRWERRMFHTLVAIEAADGGGELPRWLASQNITPDGMAVEAEPGQASIPVGTRLRVVFYVPTHFEPIHGEVEVVWHRPFESQGRYGLRFLRLVPGGIQRIATFGGFGLRPGELLGPVAGEA